MLQGRGGFCSELRFPERAGRSGPNSRRSGERLMLQSYGATQQAFAEDHGGGDNLGLQHYWAVAKRRIFYFLIPFVLIFLLAAVLVAIQHPLYQAQGKILVETAAIPADLVRPTVTDTANQRIQVIQQRITTRDNLLGIVKKFDLFPSEQQWMSSSQILDLMRQRTELKLVDLTLPAQANNLTIAFTLSFEYENPEIAARVANEFLTLILNEDARNRANRASETTKFLEQEVKRLQTVEASIQAQITEISLKPPDPTEEIPEELKAEQAELAKLKLDLVQKSTIYSNGHPAVITLKKRIAALEKIISDAPAKASRAADRPDTGLDALRRQLVATDTALDDANRKLSAARLGESMERNQEAERLQVIEQPAVPQKPSKPNRPKLLAVAFVLAAMAGIGAVMAAEMLDKSIHNVRELAGVVDSRLIVAIPYIATAAEARRRKKKARSLLVGVAVIGCAAFAFALYLGLSLDLSSWTDRAWIDQLRHLFLTK
jgi:protein tyrosine kinase modulator